MLPAFRTLPAIVVLGLLANSAHADERVFDKSFTVAPGGTLIIDTDTGSIVVSGSDANQVIIHATLRGSRGRVEDFDLTATATASGVEVHGKRDPSGWVPFAWFIGETLEVAYTIQVPRSYQVHARTSGDNMEVRDVSGNANLRTSGGNVRINGFNGDAEIRTSGGNIRAVQVAGNVKLYTSGGDIQVSQARADVSARTSGGNIRLQVIDSSVHATTSGGDIDVALEGDNRGVDVNTSGGDITVRVPREFKATVTARTSGGDVECNLPVTSMGKHKRSTLQGDINGGGQPLVARTSGGDIVIEPIKL